MPVLEALLVSTAVVALGELGDKTQLLALVLAARFRRPWPIAAWALKPRQARRGGTSAGDTLGRVRRDRRRVLPGRDRRQDADRDRDARRALRLAAVGRRQ